MEISVIMTYEGGQYGPWRARIIEAFQNLGGDAKYRALYAELGKQRAKPLTPNERAGVRREIENHSSCSMNWRPWRPDLFFSLAGLGSGHWGLRSYLNREEFVVVGWSDPEGSRHRLGSLLLGYYTPDGKLIYAGRAGPGQGWTTGSWSGCGGNCNR
jgi:hypothetical protein